MNISLPTVKKLFLSAPNRCSFPKCTTPLIDQAGHVLAQICHIKGEKPSAARYDSNQSETERNLFDNLILMCSVHHKVIDDDEEAYSVDRLMALKDKHNKLSDEKGKEISDEQAKEAIENAVIIHGQINAPVVISQNQLGGQTAYSITNNATPPRRIQDSAINITCNELKKYNALGIKFWIPWADSEAQVLAQDIEMVVKNSGWAIKSFEHRVENKPIYGLVIGVPHVLKDDIRILILYNWLKQCGLNPQAELIDQQDIVIRVGHNPISR